MDNSALIQLSEKLAHDEAAGVLGEVALALEQPEVYFATYEQRLEERGIDETFEDLAWIALVDALIERELAFEIDWKDSGVYVCDVVDELLNRKGIPVPDWVEFEDESYGGYSPDQFKAEVSKKLKEHGIALAYLDIDSDSYVLVTVPLADLSDIKKLAVEAGFSIKDTFVEI